MFECHRVNAVSCSSSQILLAAQFVAMASLLKYAFQMDYTYAAILSGLVIIGYTAFAGMACVIITDTVQFIIIVIMMLA